MQTTPLSYSPTPQSQPSATPDAIVALLAVAKEDVMRYPCGTATAVPAHTTTAAMQALEQMRPRVVVIDWDLSTLAVDAVCPAAAQRTATTILITTSATDRVPAALRCGAHAVLLKPFSVNLAAARIGRLCRDASVRLPSAIRGMVERGTNRTWQNTACPHCAMHGAISFDFASHRTAWYACPACEHVWRGPRQE